MARVTVEDCLKNVKNRFELVLVASKRARQLMRGKESRVEWDNDKATVVALREIAAGFTDVDATDEQQAPEPIIKPILPVLMSDEQDPEEEKAIPEERLAEQPREPNDEE